MPLLNYTTKVDIYTTLGAIQGQLVKHGAKKILQDYDENGKILALSFMIDTPNGTRGIRLPANVDAVYAVLCKRRRSANFFWIYPKSLGKQSKLLRVWCSCSKYTGFNDSTGLKKDGPKAAR